MARMVSRSRPRVEGSTGVKFSELIIIGCVLFMGFMAVRYYMNYRKSARFVLEDFYSAVKAGSVDRQYALLDDQDKQMGFPTEKAYERFPLARGYNQRISSVITSEETPSKIPDAVEVSVSLTLRAEATGKALYQTGSSSSRTDHMVMRKNSKGEWKVLLSKSTMELLKQTPNPPGSNF